MNPSLLALYGLKWNPFSQELPTEALRLTLPAEDFLWRIEQNHVREGGFALIHGESLAPAKAWCCVCWRSAWDACPM